MGEHIRRFGDRYDGRLLRSIDPFSKIIPYIMKTRMDAQNMFTDKLEIDAIEEYLKKKRSSGIKNIGFLHIVIAAMVRTLSQKPRLNRFIAGQKIYARNEILISLVVKKKMHEDSPETAIKLKFAATDTLMDVVEKVNSVVDENKDPDLHNDTDRTAQVFTSGPGLLIKFTVWLLKTLDYFGVMPKLIHRVSPFHTSVFITDLGSLGIEPVYHHLYEFGTTSIFIAFGAKKRERILTRDNQILEKKFINFTVVSDERIVDGYYYANAYRLFRRLMKDPERLEIPPEVVVKDID